MVKSAWIKVVFYGKQSIRHVERRKWKLYTRPLMYQYDRANETNWYFEKQYIQLEKGYTTLNTIFNAKVKLPFNITYQFNIAPPFSIFL